jgi:hypothetical protein
VQLRRDRRLSSTQPVEQRLLIAIGHGRRRLDGVAQFARDPVRFAKREIFGGCA